MDKNTIVSSFAESEEEKIKFAHLLDAEKRRRDKCIVTTTAFLSESERMRAERLLSHLGTEDFFFWGGYDGAERRVALFLPDYLGEEQVREDASLSGITLLRAEVDKFYRDAELTHRDVLGSLMALGVVRETVGDIIALGGVVELAVTSKVSPYILESLEKISRYPVKVRVIDALTLEKKGEGEERFDTVSSLRLDAVVASLFSLSRSSSADAISSGLVTLDGVTQKKPDAEVREGALLTLKGSGRARLCKVEGVSKKGRVRIIFKK